MKKQKQKLLLTTAVVAATLAVASPSMAKTSHDPSVAYIQSLSGMAVAIDAFGRASVDGKNIAQHVSAEAKSYSKLADVNILCPNTNCTCKPPHAPDLNKGPLPA